MQTKVYSDVISTVHMYLYEKINNVDDQEKELNRKSYDQNSLGDFQIFEFIH